MPKILIFGGQNSGKSKIAEQIALNLSKQKPFYIATYDNSFQDPLMDVKIKEHLLQRADRFVTIEETKELSKVIDKGVYLIDSITTWVFNLLNKDRSLSELNSLFDKDATIVFVADDINSGVLPSKKSVRDFVELNSHIVNYIASRCDEVYEIKYGLKRRWK